MGMAMSYYLNMDAIERQKVIASYQSQISTLEAENAKFNSLILDIQKTIAEHPEYNQTYITVLNQNIQMYSTKILANNAKLSQLKTALQNAPQPTNPPASTNPDFPYDTVTRFRTLEANSLELRPDDMFGVFGLYMMWKEPKMLKDIIIKWLDTQGRMVQALSQAQHNPIAAYANSFLMALMLEQQYFIRARGADDLIASLNWVWGANELTSFFSGLFGSGSQFPATVVYATTGGSETPERGELMRAIAGKGESGKKEDKKKAPPLASEALQAASTIIPKLL